MPRLACTRALIVRDDHSRQAEVEPFEAITLLLEHIGPVIRLSAHRNAAFDSGVEGLKASRTAASKKDKAGAVSGKLKDWEALNWDGTGGAQGGPA